MLIEFNNNVFSTNLRYLRKKYRLSLISLAKLAGLTPLHLLRLEQGKIDLVITDQALCRICAVFDVKVEQIVHTQLLWK